MLRARPPVPRPHPIPVTKAPETYGECPQLTGDIAVAFNKGIAGFNALNDSARQFNGAWKVMGTVRHFVRQLRHRIRTILQAFLSFTPSHAPCDVPCVVPMLLMLVVVLI